jgi:hypothetical protein
VNLPYFKEIAGTDDIGGSLRMIAIWTAVYAAIFLPPIWIGLHLRRGRDVSILVGAAIAIVGLFTWRSIDWTEFVRPLPVIMGIAVIVLLVVTTLRKTTNWMPLVLSIWGLLMLAKIPLHARIAHYGFALAMPATLAMIAMLLGWLPAWIEKRGGSGSLLRSVVLACLGVSIVAHCSGLHYFWQAKDVIIGTGGDAFRADQRGPFVNAAMDHLQKLAPPGATLVAIPEGLIVNYLTRRENPTGYIQFTPPNLIMYGEAEMLSAFELHPPDFILITRIDEGGYGASYFGVDYGKQLNTWIEQFYTPIAIVGRRPNEVHDYDMTLLKHR